MAKVKVLNEFIDIHTGNLHKIGDVFEADDTRIAEIMKTNKDLIMIQEEVKEVKKTRKKAGEQNV
jgi:hypothetical protein